MKKNLHSLLGKKKEKRIIQEGEQKGREMSIGAAKRKALSSPINGTQNGNHHSLLAQYKELTQISKISFEFYSEI